MESSEGSTMEDDGRQELVCPADDRYVSLRMLENATGATNTKKSQKSSITANKEHKSNLRKRLGCRRSLKDMLSPSEQQCIERRKDAQGRDGVVGRKIAPRRPQRRLVFTSPRVVSSDEDLFPSNHSLYKESSQRWRQISDQAGSHRQDGLVMNIGRRPSIANAFRVGMIGCAAVRVRSLNLWLDHEKDTLPDWLDMIGEVFVNLEHLTLTEDIFPGEDDMAVSARMRRLYVLSILPRLKSIDDMVVTPKEREMANPGCYSNNEELHQNESQIPRSESIDENSGHENDSRFLSIPVSINTDSVGSSRANGIEVEMLEGKFGDVYPSATETTASCGESPTIDSEITITNVGGDDKFLFEDEDDLVGAEFLNDTMLSHLVRSIDTNTDDCDSERKYTIQGQIPSTEDIQVDLLNRLGSVDVDGDPNRRIKDPRRSISNKTHSIDDSGMEVTRAKVGTFHGDPKNSIELVSVVSTDVEWSAACGILKFRKDKTCAPSIRLPFSFGSSKTKMIAQDPSNQIRQESVKSLLTKAREKKSSLLKACTPVQRQSKDTVPAPQNSHCETMKKGQSSESKFSFQAENRYFSADRDQCQEHFSEYVISPNKKIPPSKSLSSPFPMQFRERQKLKCTPPTITTTTAQFVVKASGSVDSDSGIVKSRYCSIESETETIVSPLEIITSRVSSPTTSDRSSKVAQKGDLPPSCPFGKTRRKAAANYAPKQRKSRRQKKNSFDEISKENARSTSVMDLDDEEESFDKYCEIDEIKEGSSSMGETSRGFEILVE